VSIKKHETVLITGATGKLGRAFALGFSSLGCGVILATRRMAAAVDLRDECLAKGARYAEFIELDLQTFDPAETVTQLRRSGVSPTVLVNNARSTSFLAVDDDQKVPRSNWYGEFTLGVVAPYELTMALADATDSELHSVINIASMYGVTAPNLRLYENPSRQSFVNYGVVKAALIHLTKELAVRLAPRVRVNAISYGGVEGKVDEGFKHRYSQLCPSGRMLSDLEVFGAAKFLAFDDSSAMTGHNLVVDGGWTVW
jgi:NAD(P)-dependent dehydrogenase (short-subunit alcohol dehydrogenase family)